MSPVSTVTEQQRPAVQRAIRMQRCRGAPVCAHLQVTLLQRTLLTAKRVTRRVSFAVGQRRMLALRVTLMQFCQEGHRHLHVCAFLQDTIPLPAQRAASRAILHATIVQEAQVHCALPASQTHRSLGSFQTAVSATQASTHQAPPQTAKAVMLPVQPVLEGQQIAVQAVTAMQACP